MRSRTRSATAWACRPSAISQVAARRGYPAGGRSDPAWLQPYLDRLGVVRPGRPTVEALFALHRAQLERVAYETIDIVLGRPPGIDPVESIGRIVAGRIAADRERPSPVRTATAQSTTSRRSIIPALPVPQSK